MGKNKIKLSEFKEMIKTYVDLDENGDVLAIKPGAVVKMDIPSIAVSILMQYVSNILTGYANNNPEKYEQLISKLMETKEMIDNNNDAPKFDFSKYDIEELMILIVFGIQDEFRKRAKEEGLYIKEKYEKYEEMMIKMFKENIDFEEQTEDTQQNTSENDGTQNNT